MGLRHRIAALLEFYGVYAPPSDTELARHLESQGRAVPLYSVRRHRSWLRVPRNLRILTAWRAAAAARAMNALTPASYPTRTDRRSRARRAA